MAHETIRRLPRSPSRLRARSRRRSRIETCVLAWLTLHQLLGPSAAEALIDLQVGKPLQSSARFSRPAAPPDAGSADVDLFTGQATVRIPIEVPPGTGESTPSIALAYGSHGSNRDGPLGVGWSLDVGPATIERSTKYGAPAYDESDTFVYGGKDLIATATPGRFATEEFDHSRIEFVASGLFGYWRVLRPDGTRLYYGFENVPSGASANESVATSIQVNPVSPTQASCPVPPRPVPSTNPICALEEPIIEELVPFSWHLDRVEDRNGNVIRYRWQSLGDQGARYLTEISYSTHVAGAREQVPSFGGADDGSLARSRNVRFDYDLVRTDAFATHRTGFPRVVAHRLTDIIIEVDSALVRHYVLEYDQSPVSGRSRLRTLRERNSSGSASAERVTNLHYGDGGSKGWGPLDSTFALPAGLTFTTASGRDRGVRVFDVNGDGWVDIVQGDSGLRRTFLGGPSGFSAVVSSAWAPPANFVDSAGFTGLVVGDFDGDGLPDYMQRRLRVTGSLTRTGASCGTSTQHQVASSFQAGMWRNTGSGWVSNIENSPQAPFPDSLTVSDYPTRNSCPDAFLPTSIELTGLNVGFDQGTRVVDINGDGLDDLAYNRGLQGFSVQSQTVAQTIDEVRAGTLLNTGEGFAGSVPNDFFYSMFDPLAVESGNYRDYAHFLKLYRSSAPPSRMNQYDRGPSSVV